MPRGDTRRESGRLSRDEEGRICEVRIAGKEPVLLPGRTAVLVECTVKPAVSQTPYEALIEQQENLSAHLQNGVFVCPTMVKVSENGRILSQVLNLAPCDVYLQPRTPVAILRAVEDLNEPVNVSLQEQRVSETQWYDKVLPEIDFGPNITESETKTVLGMLSMHKGVFSTSDDDVGFCDKIKHTIPLSDDTPIKVPHRRIPPHEWQEVREHLQKLLKQKVIQESSSPFASPVVLVRKKDGKLRLCVDYRALNNKTPKDAYPLPRIEEALDALKGAKYFCSLDLSHGYYQVPVAEEDVEKTAFPAGTGGLYEYLRMPFGLCNAPATFMRLMDHIFGDQNMQTLLIYLDDILVFGSTVEETTARLKMVIERLERHNLKLKPRRTPTFYEKWESGHEEAFCSLKEKLLSSPILGYPVFTEPFILETDASFHGLGAVLSQKQGEKVVVLAYASRELRPHEKDMENYSSMKLELLALKWAITEKFRDLLIGAEFVVWTDNNPLSYLQTSTKLGATETRWTAELSPFRFKVKYRSGKSNQNADSLSRKTQHGTEPQTVRFEQILAKQLEKAPRQTSLIPPELVQKVCDNTDQVWLREIGCKSANTRPSSTSTFPSFNQIKLIQLQQSDPY
ncbi:hypothetical protein BSL78_29118 [Apostichopus japonicus]|uniref:Reverse transcriptase domain-containing protein n=1 Tax=Stichopus japonicus TaxID=307972 RepID=A0A2G8JE76_STIJA|nr:hypothetical protein BSL78_29118 [Apostichopus japonicus]